MIYHRYIKNRPSRIKLLITRQTWLSHLLLSLCTTMCFLGIIWFCWTLPIIHEHITLLRNQILETNTPRIKSIRITGSQITDEKNIYHLLGVRVGDPLLSFNIQRASAQLNTLPFVKHVTIIRHLSGDIVIHIVERYPYAIWQHQGQFTLIDKEGQDVQDQKINNKEKAMLLKLPLVVGNGANTSAATLFDILSQEPNVKSHVVAAVRVNNRRWNLTLNNGTIILLPEIPEETTAAIHYLAKLETSINLLDRPILSIDMRLPDRLTIKIPPKQQDTLTPISDTHKNS